MSSASKGFAKANPTVPLVSGHQDNKVVEPLSAIQKKVDAVVSDVKTIDDGVSALVDSFNKKDSELRASVAKLELKLQAFSNLLTEIHTKGEIAPNFDLRLEEIEADLLQKNKEEQEKAFDEANGFENTDGVAKVGDIIVANLKFIDIEKKEVIHELKYAPFLVGKNILFQGLGNFDDNFVGMKAGDSKGFDYSPHEDHALSKTKMNVSIEAIKVKTKKVKGEENANS